MSNMINDSYIDNYSFGGSTSDDVLLLVIGSVTPVIDQGEGYLKMTREGPSTQAKRRPF